MCACKGWCVLGVCTWREPVLAGDGLNVALPALTSAIKGNKPASPAHFLNPAGLFAGGKRAAQAQETHQWVTFFFWGGRVGRYGLLFVVASCPRFVVGGLRVAECP